MRAFITILITGGSQIGARGCYRGAIDCLCVAIKSVADRSLRHQIAVAGGSQKWLEINRSTLVNHLESHCCLVTVVVVPMWCCWLPTNGCNVLIVLAAWPVVLVRSSGCGSDQSAGHLVGSGSPFVNDDPSSCVG